MERFVFDDANCVRINVVKSEKCDLYTFLKEKGQTIPNGKENEQGYRLEYIDGYVSWCPAETSEMVSHYFSNLPFSVALYLCQFYNVRILRKGWKHCKYVYKTLVANGSDVYEPRLVLHDDDIENGENINVGWVASQEDIMAMDWGLFEFK